MGKGRVRPQRGGGLESRRTAVPGPKCRQVVHNADQGGARVGLQQQQVGADQVGRLLGVGVIRGAQLMEGDVWDLPEDGSKLSLQLSEPGAIPGIVELASRLQCLSIRAYILRIEHSAFFTSFARGAGVPYFTT